MKLLHLLRTQAFFMMFLMVSLPVVLAAQLDLQYDANGNLVSGDGFYREYNELNQLVRVREGNAAGGTILEEFVFHPTEERVLIKDVYESGSLKESIYYVSNEFIRIENGSGNFTEKYVYQENTLVAQVNTDGEKEFVLPDHLGSADTILDASGNIIHNNFYSPYGEQLDFDGSRFGYEGKEQSSATGEVDFHFRMYKPEWGRFTQPDSILQDVHDPQLLNRYSFERNNPLVHIDPDGHLIQIPAGFLLRAAALFILNQARKALAEPHIAVARIVKLTKDTVEKAKKLFGDDKNVATPEQIEALKNAAPKSDDAAKGHQEQTKARFDKIPEIKNANDEAEDEDTEFVDKKIGDDEPVDTEQELTTKPERNKITGAAVGARPSGGGTGGGSNVDCSQQKCKSKCDSNGNCETTCTPYCVRI